MRTRERIGRRGLLPRCQLNHPSRIPPAAIGCRVASAANGSGTEARRYRMRCGLRLSPPARRPLPVVPCPCALRPGPCALPPELPPGRFDHRHRRRHGQQGNEQRQPEPEAHPLRQARGSLQRCRRFAHRRGLSYAPRPGSRVRSPCRGRRGGWRCPLSAQLLSGTASPPARRSRCRAAWRCARWCRSPVRWPGSSAGAGPSGSRSRGTSIRSAPGRSRT